jgi:dTDP-4-amino-4,6-dideoxygalactose transaminase
MNPHQVTKDFERALCEYTGAPFAVAVTSCTMALLLAVAWYVRKTPVPGYMENFGESCGRPYVEIPKRTYVSVPQSIIHAGGWPTFRDEEWKGMYQLKPLPVWDAARLFTHGMYRGTREHGCVDRAALPSGKRAEIHLTENSNFAGHMVCLSFHWSKTLGIQQGGAILHDDYEADQWLRRARFDGRTEGVPPSMDKFTQIGWHCYMSPEVAAEGLIRLSLLPQHNDPLPNDDYPDLSQMPIFQ